jgi:hypothetical protein
MYWAQEDMRNFDKYDPTEGPYKKYMDPMQDNYLYQKKLGNEEPICQPKNQIVIVKDLRTPTAANNTQAATGSQVKQFLYNNLQQASNAANSTINYVFMRL